MNYYKTKDIQLEQLLEEIDKATNEERYTVVEITSTAGVIMHDSGPFNINDSKITIIDDNGGKKILRIAPYSFIRAQVPNIYFDITNSQNYHITDCGANGGIANPSTGRIANCRMYKLDTRQTNIDGTPACTIRIHIEVNQK